MATAALKKWEKIEKKAGGPDTIRTYDLCLRRAALYPAELRVRAAVVLAPRGARRKEVGVG
jgi:hypothetical protein